MQGENIQEKTRKEEDMALKTKRICGKKSGNMQQC